MTTTTIEVNGKSIKLQTDDKELHSFLVRQIIEQTAATELSRAPASNTNRLRDSVSGFVDLCQRYESQLGVLRFLAENDGKATKDQLIQAAGKATGKNLAGCRGSISKNARKAGLGRHWWADRHFPDGGYECTVDGAVLEELKVAVSSR